MAFSLGATNSNETSRPASLAGTPSHGIGLGLHRPQRPEEGESQMAKKRRRLELCRRGGRFWLLVSDGRQFSGSTAAELLAAVRAGAGDDPIALNGADDVVVRRPMAAFALILEALHPTEELLPQLENAINESSNWPWLFNLGTRVNTKPWGWIAVDNPTRWHLVPFEFEKEEPSILYASACFTESMTGASFSSSVLLRDCVSLEICRGDDLWGDWVAVRYDVTSPWDAARTHLGRDNMGLSGEGADIGCPFCTDDPSPGWETTISASTPLSPDFIGEALVRLYHPCDAHKRCRRVVEILETPYVWRYGRWVEPHRLGASRMDMPSTSRAEA